MSATVPRLLLAGATPGKAAGNAVSTEVLHCALSPHADVTQLAHRMSPVPRYALSGNGGRSRVELGTQPLSVHLEGLLPGVVHRRRLGSWQGAWVVNSRYAGAVYAAGVPYVIWEATTLRDELRTSSLRTVRQSGGSGLGRTLHSAMLPINDRIERRFYERAAAVLAMSAYTRERIIEQYDISPERVGVLLHPPSPSFMKILANRRDLIPSRERTSDAPWRLLFVGRADDPRKRFGLLIETMRLLVDDGRPVRLTVIGPHTEHWRRTLQLSGIADAIQFDGAVSANALADAYLTHDALVLSSYQEGFGIVVAEALAAGLPVISTCCGGPEQIIIESGAGVLVGHDAPALAAGIMGILSDAGRANEMHRRGRAYADSVLSFAPFAAAVADATRRLLGGA